MKKKISIKLILFMVMIVIIMVVNIMAIVLFRNLLSDARQQILTVQQESLQQFAKQIKIRLTVSQNYIFQQLEDSKWQDFNKDSGKLKYEIAKTELKSRIERQVNGVYASLNLMDGALCLLKNTGELVEARKTSKISYEESDELKEWFRNSEGVEWTICASGKSTYLITVVDDATMKIGMYVKLETVCQEWEAVSDYPLVIMERAGRKEMPDCYKISEEFINDDFEMFFYVPEEDIGRQMPKRYIILLTMLLATGVLTILNLALFQILLVDPLHNMEKVIGEIEAGANDTKMAEDGAIQEIQVLQKSFNRMMDKIYGLKIQTYEMEIENQKAQLINLQLQINPHLLLNALNTVYSLSEIEDNESIKVFTMHMVKYFRYSLRNINEFVCLKQELEFVKSYVEIQKIRYPELFHFIYDVEEELLDEKIPPLIIENFVENSIKYCPKSRVTEIYVLIRSQEDILNISICDDGDGIALPILKVLQAGEPYLKDGEEHMGIWNCRRRLSLFYGERAQFSINSSAGGTQIYFSIPRG